MAFDFLSNIEKERTTPVKRFQIFEATVGADVVAVKIPLEPASAFEDAASKNKPRSVRALKRLAEQFKGHIE